MYLEEKTIYKRIPLLTLLSTAYALQGAANDKTVKKTVQRFEKAITKKDTAEAITQLQSLKAKDVAESKLYALAIQLDRPQDNNALGNILDCFPMRSYSWINLRRAQNWETLRHGHAAEAMLEPRVYNNHIKPCNPIIEEEYSFSDASSDNEAGYCSYLSDTRDDSFIESWDSISDFDENTGVYECDTALCTTAYLGGE